MNIGDIDFEQEIKKDVDIIADMYKDNKSDDEIFKTTGVPLGIIQHVIGSLNAVLGMSPKARISFVAGDGYTEKQCGVGTCPPLYFLCPDTECPSQAKRESGQY